MVPFFFSSAWLARMVKKRFHFLFFVAFFPFS